MLLPFMRDVVVSAEIGCCKPDPAIFQTALGLLGARPDEVAMVGDRLPTDIAGARRAGLRAVLADFLGDRTQMPPGQPTPDAVVRHPKDLVPLVTGWMRE